MVIKKEKKKIKKVDKIIKATEDKKSGKKPAPKKPGFIASLFNDIEG